MHSMPAINDYERRVMRQIAAWRTQRRAGLGRVLNQLSRPFGWGLSRLMPKSAINAAISAAYSTSRWLAEPNGSAIVSERRSLELSDNLAARVRRVALSAAFIDGAVTGMAGFILAPVDVAALTLIALNAIHRTGHCYGFALDAKEDRQYVLAILMLAGTNALCERENQFARFQDFRGWVFSRTVESLAMETLTRQFAQISALEAVPGIGMAIGSAINVSFIGQVLTDCQRVFQQRWLGENGRYAGQSFGIEPYG